MPLITVTFTYDTDTKKTEILSHDATENYEFVTERVNIEGFVMQTGDYTFGKTIDGYSGNHLMIPIKMYYYDERNLLRKKKYDEYIGIRNKK